MTNGGGAGNAGMSAPRTAPVDRVFGERPQGYNLTEIRRVDGKLLRVRIYRDFYPHQSHALVEVLTPAMTWTELTTEPASAWHSATPSRSTSPAPLDNLAERLFQRAEAILRTE
ncbi:hypothetical protein KIF24_28550 [Micromonospora sp. Llam7]|uniref:hypothetical protein n=1 Tax=Micromonospora tarapacensis TaxID=2835305 RepID=UPI001C82A6D5|nr:hypothetical protein [Micromonospora tarapacensis]MBX7269570.1 hypothetical protein [Micromonospora tarapacensis]